MELAEGTEPGEQMKEKYMQANYQFVCMYFLVNKQTKVKIKKEKIKQKIKQKVTKIKIKQKVTKMKTNKKTIN